ncbi:MAG: hypothetical protein INR69_18570 [Mucilaginibacter polytrichastri]|nr:hypothetical protein [Mucilaginibacter polytrichastri]
MEKEQQNTGDLFSNADNAEDRLMDSSNSDAAANNAREQERIEESRRTGGGLIDPETAQRADDDDVAGEDADRKVRLDDDTDAPESLSAADRDNLAGSTNLPLDELKKGENPTGREPEPDDSIVNR